MLDAKLFHVYYICDATGVLLLYVGRGLNPEGRQRRFQLRTGIGNTVLRWTPGLPLADAQKLECSEISELKPPFNRGAVHSSAAFFGKTFSAKTKKRLAETSAGRARPVLTAESRERIGSARRAAFTPEERARYSDMVTARWRSSKYRDKVMKSRYGNGKWLLAVKKSHKNPDRCRKISEGLRKAWAEGRH